jgi:hypothetical protein
MSEKYYIIKSNLNYNNKKYSKYYYVNVFSKKNEDTILVGGLNIKCVNIIINKKRNKGILELVQHHEKCSFFDTLKDGFEMTDLVKNSLYFTMYMYPDVLSYELVDNSFIPCKNGKRISLADLQFVKYGKTWYENKFGAVSKNKNVINFIKKNIIEKLNKKINLSYDQFIKEYYDEDFFANSKNINLIKITYKSENTFNEYLNYFFKNKLDCIFYQYIFQEYIGNLLQGNEWIIEKSIIENYNINAIIIDTGKIRNHKNLDLLYKKLEIIKKKEDEKKGGGVFSRGYID